MRYGDGPHFQDPLWLENGYGKYEKNRLFSELKFSICIFNILEDYINDLQRLSPSQLSAARKSLARSNVDFTSVVVDGLFFTEDPSQKVRAGNVRSDVTYVIITNSFEGSLSYMTMSFAGFTNETFTFPAMKSRLEMFGNPQDLE